jgi:hypothetical protein
VTAYRSADAPADVPYVNPYLERALLEYYGKARRQNVIPFAILVSVTILIGLWVLSLDASGGLRRAPLLGVVAAPSAFGSAIMGFLLFRKPRQHLLERIRTGIPIRRVRRDDASALHVDFADGSTQLLPSLGDLRHLARIEHLLGVQMVQGSAPTRHARAG